MALILVFSMFGSLVSADGGDETPALTNVINYINFGTYAGKIVNYSDNTGTVDFYLPPGTNLGQTPYYINLGISDGSSISYNNGVKDWPVPGSYPWYVYNPNIFKVASGDGTYRNYTLKGYASELPTSNDLTSFSINGIAGKINNDTDSVEVTVPYGTDLTNIKPQFSHNGFYAEINGVAQKSNVDAVDFSSPVLYKIHSVSDASTHDYLVTVNVLPNMTLTLTTDKTSYKPGEPVVVTVSASGTTNINENGVNRIKTTLEFNPTEFSVESYIDEDDEYTEGYYKPLVAREDAYMNTPYILKMSSPSAKYLILDLHSEIPFKDGPVYQVTLDSLDTLGSYDASLNIYIGTVKAGNDYIGESPIIVNTLVKVVAPSSEKQITQFSLLGNEGSINQDDRTVDVLVPFDTDLDDVASQFSVSDGASVKVGTTEQVSGTTPNNFTSSVTYTVYAEDESYQDYLVSVSRAAVIPIPNSSKDLGTFSVLNKYGIINQADKTVDVLVPSDADLTALASHFTTTGASVKVGDITQESGVTLNNFTHPVTYTVYAEDESYQDYKVTVNLAPPVVDEPPVVVTPPTGNPSTGSGSTPTATPTPPVTPVAPVTPTTKPFFNEKVNIDVIKALVEKVNTAPAVTFKDVPANAPNAKAIELAAKLGIIKGNADGSFHANATITRAEFATMLVRALGLTSEGDSSFKDIKGHWAADTIATLKASGIINGYADGTFKPNQTITRAEIVAMLSKVMNTTIVKNDKFNDVSGNWAEAEIATLSDMGIVKGSADGSFKPNANATRSESLVMILRMLNASLGDSLDIE
ncbi:S-layer homology domain-containing protein [Paenibacillus sp. FA6]|uniref:S-layer homology domain-containing protein n=1 Tax=Paenibacillus sp. FA6 TaxID=3413029 RepID=UPI003F658438